MSPAETELIGRAFFAEQDRLGASLPLISVQLPMSPKSITFRRWIEAATIRWRSAFTEHFPTCIR